MNVFKRHGVRRFAPVLSFPWCLKCLKMAALPGIKYDDGSGAHVTNCFPVRSINSISEEGTDQF